MLSLSRSSAVVSGSPAEGPSFKQHLEEQINHVNALQRDMCPSQTRFEAEIIAMTLDMLHADAVEKDTP